MFTIGLLALAISANVDAKNVEKSKKNSSQTSCTAGMTSCGKTYQSCDDGGAWSDEDNLALYDDMDSKLCP